MEKLVLQEIWTELFSSKAKRPYRYLITAVKIICFLAVIFCARNLAVIFITITISSIWLGGNIADCIYMIPGNVKNYIIVKYKMTIIIELLLYIVSMLAEYISCVYIDGQEFVICFGIGRIFLTVAGILYILVKNTWLLYEKFSIEELKKYKCAQGLGLFWYFLIYMIADIAGEKLETPMMFIMELAVVGGFAAYTIYICVFVKKNLIVKTYK